MYITNSDISLFNVLCSIFFLEIFFVDTCPFLGPLIPCFELLVMSTLNLKCLALCDGCSLKFTSGATPAGILTASMATGSCSPRACFSRGRMPESNGRAPV